MRSYSYCSLQEIFSKNQLQYFRPKGTPGYSGYDLNYDNCFKTIIINSSAEEAIAKNEVITLMLGEL